MNNGRYLYQPRGRAVEAIQWTGDNFDEVKSFIEERLGSDCGVRCDPFTIGGSTYHTLQFYAWGDDQEVDPTWWVVITNRMTTPPDGQIMHDTDFHCVYVKKEL